MEPSPASQCAVGVGGAVGFVDGLTVTVVFFAAGAEDFEEDTEGGWPFVPDDSGGGLAFIALIPSPP